jgi:hypothetical protein
MEKKSHKAKGDRQFPSSKQPPKADKAAYRQEERTSRRRKALSSTCQKRLRRYEVAESGAEGEARGRRLHGRSPHCVTLRAPAQDCSKSAALRPKRLGHSIQLCSDKYVASNARGSTPATSRSSSRGLGTSDRIHCVFYPQHRPLHPSS